MDVNIWNSIENKWLQIWEQNAINTSDPIRAKRNFSLQLPIRTQTHHSILDTEGPTL